MTAKHELNLLYLSLRALSVPSLPEELVRYIYEFRMLAIAGEAPRIFECIRCGKTENLHHFYVGDAGIVCDDCHDGKTGILLSETAIYTLQRILAASKIIYFFGQRGSACPVKRSCFTIF